LLEMEGFVVVTAQNGLEALEELKTASRVSVIVLDLWMPLMSGWEFLRQRRAEVESIANIPVIALSALPLSAPLKGREQSYKSRSIQDDYSTQSSAASRSCAECLRMRRPDLHPNTLPLPLLRQSITAAALGASSSSSTKSPH